LHGLVNSTKIVTLVLTYISTTNVQHPITIVHLINNTFSYDNINKIFL